MTTDRQYGYATRTGLSCGGYFGLHTQITGGGTLRCPTHNMSVYTMCYNKEVKQMDGADTMTKDAVISLRVNSEWLAAIDEATRIRSKQLGVPLSRNSFIELAAMNYAEQLGLIVDEQLANTAINQNAINAEMDEAEGVLGMSQEERDAQLWDQIVKDMPDD